MTRPHPPARSHAELREVLPAHGSPVIGNARDLYRPAIERVTA